MGELKQKNRDTLSVPVRLFIKKTANKSNFREMDCLQ